MGLFDKKFCSACGAQTLENASFCCACGTELSEKKKSKLPLLLRIGSVSVLVIGIAIALVAGCSIGNWIKTPGFDPQELAAKLAGLTETASEHAPENAPAALDSALPAPSPTPAIVYEPYVFDEAIAVPASRLLEYYGLNAVETRLYEELLAGLKNLEPLIYIETPLDYYDDDDFGMLILARDALTAVHPEMFWVSGRWDFALSTDGTIIVEPHYLIDGQIFGAEFDGSWYLLPTDSEMADAKAWIEMQQSELRNVLDVLPVHSGMSPFELELAVFDWLSLNVTYDTGAPNRDSMYGALIDKTSACEGYSNAFQYIMGLMGIECLMIYGTYDDGPHGWNAVKLDGQWYQVDVTSGATNFIDAGLPYRMYFNRTDEFMSSGDHAWWHGKDIRLNAPIDCTATEYNYFVKIGQRTITSDEDFKRIVPDYIARARAESRPMFELEFDPAYARPGEIEEKIKLIDSRLWEDIHFDWTSRLIIGVFD